MYPRPVQNPLPIWIGVGGTPQSFARAGVLGLPLMVAIIGGEPHRFRPLIDLYREAGRRAGHIPDQLSVGIHMLGFIADTTEEAADTFFPAYVRVFNRIDVNAAGLRSPAISSTRCAGREERWSSGIPKPLPAKSVMSMKRSAASRGLRSSSPPGPSLMSR